MKIGRRVQEIWSENEIEGGKLHDLEVDLDLESRFMGSTHCLTERVIRLKLTINRSNGSEDIKRIQN